MTKNLLSVMLFAFVGGCLRAGCGQLWGSFWGTILVNLVGSFLLAFLTYHAVLKEQLNLGIGTGLVGSFTTFGTFSLQSVQLLQHSFLAGVGFLTINLLGGFLMALGGFKLALRLNQE